MSEFGVAQGQNSGPWYSGAATYSDPSGAYGQGGNMNMSMAYTANTTSFDDEPPLLEGECTAAAPFKDHSAASSS
jgi:hypothetical protein